MNLDPRIKDPTKIYDVFNCQEARNGCTAGYFADSRAAFADLKSCLRAYLVTIEEDNPHPFYAGVVDGGCIIKGNFQFFTSVDNTTRDDTAGDAIAEDKKYRAYTLSEFKQIFKTGAVISFRTKEGDIYKDLILGGYVTDGTVTKILIGPAYYTLEELFTYYEWTDPLNDSGYQPFGVAE